MKHELLTEENKKRIAWTVLAVLIVLMVYFSWSSGMSYKKDPSKAKNLSNFIEKEGSSKPKLKVLIEELAFRNSPGVTYDNQIGQVRKGAILTLIGKEGSWYKVVSPGKRKGYISAKPGYTELLK